jgi:hypothetical protein
MFSALVGRSVDTKALIGPIPSSEEVLKRTLHLTARLRLHGAAQSVGTMNAYFGLIGDQAGGRSGSLR